MAHCLLCSSAIIVDAQYYMTVNIGPEITSVLQQNFGHKILEDGIICDKCFTNSMKCIDSASSSNIQHDVHTSSPETKVCVWCQSSLFKRRSHVLGIGPEQQLILERISHRTIPDGSSVCYTCWVYVRKALQTNGITSTPIVNTNICVICQTSLAHKRKHSIPEGPKKDHIIQSIYPREIPPEGLICHTCWVATCRKVQKAYKHNVNVDESPGPRPSQSHNKDVCVWCRTSLFRRHTYILKGRVRDEIAARIFPSELPQCALVCSNCLTKAKKNILIQQGHVLDVSTDNTKMTLNLFSHTTNSSARCFVPGCQNSERFIVPEYLRMRILKYKKIFVTNKSRICAHHKSVHNWEFLDQYQFSRTFSKQEMESMLVLSVNEAEFSVNFENFENINDGLFKYWTGTDKEQYLQILNFISPAFSSSDKPKTSLAVYLMKLNTGDSDERLSSVLGISKSTVTRLLEKTTQVLNSLFTPENLGVNHSS